MGGNTGVAPSVDGCALHDPKLVSEILAEEARQRDIDQQLEEVCAFTAGEILLIRGGFFKVHAHAGKRLYLDFQGFAKDVLKRPE
jgi:hypothetical protein